MEKELRKMEDFKPIIKNWEFKFPKEKLKEAKDILVAFSKVYTAKEKHFDAPSEFVISGSVYGREGTPDDTDIQTSFVKSIDLVDWKPDQSEWFSGKYTPDELAEFAEHEIFCVTTVSGSKYYLISDELSGYMFLYLGRLYHSA